MNQKIQNYLNQLFEGLHISDELKEELSLNLNDKYEDLIADGVSEDVAFKQVIAGIGDIEELSQQPNINQNVEIHIAHAPNRNIKIGAAVFLFITSVIPLIILGQFAPGLEVIGVTAMFIMVALGVFLLITVPKETSVTEATPDKQTPKVTPKSKLMSSVHGLVWMCAVLVFFLLNMMGTGYSWLVFVIAWLVIKLIETMMGQNDDTNIKSLIHTAIWTGTILLFFMVQTNYAWLFFILGAILTQGTNILFEMKETPHD